jgi:ABC-2 type transport system permease protein
MTALKQGKVDLVAVIPNGAMDTVKNSQQAVVQFYHNEIDPYQVSYVEYITSAYVDEVNRMVVKSYAEAGQQNASTLEQRVADARQRIQTTRQALQAGNAAAAQGEQQQLSGDLSAISLLVGGSMSVLNGLDSQTKSGSTPGSQSNLSPQNQAILDTLTKLQQNQQSMSSGSQQSQLDATGDLQKLDQMDSDLNSLETQLKDFQSIAPDVLVKPFRSQTSGIQTLKLKPSDFFAPAVIVLLLQHLAVTFSALAIVREQRMGSMELFRISPLSALETLLGKYLSYVLFGAIIAALISVTVFLGLKVPMLGSWVDYALVLLVLLFSGIGVGFLISLLAKTEMQAVQYAMFVLLGSVFFSGFFLDLRYLYTPVRVVSWMLPATYAIKMLQSIMLRGYSFDPVLFNALLAVGIALFVVAWFFLRRRLQKEWS